MRNNIWLLEIPSTTWSDFVLHGIIILGGPLPLTDQASIQKYNLAGDCWTRDWGLSPPGLSW